MQSTKKNCAKFKEITTFKNSPQYRIIIPGNENYAYIHMHAVIMYHICMSKQAYHVQDDMAGQQRIVQAYLQYLFSKHNGGGGVA